MQPFRAVIDDHLQQLAVTNESNARGRILEDLATYVIGAIDGCSVRRNVRDRRTNELDLVVTNRQVSTGMRWLPPTIGLECKAHVRRVDSRTVGSFVSTLEDRGYPVGVLLAANGITGSPELHTCAHAKVMYAALREVNVVVLTIDDIASIVSPTDLAHMILERHTHTRAMARHLSRTAAL